MKFPLLFLTLCFLVSLAHGAEEKASPGPGFVSIFDGTLKDWDGDPVYWKAQDGVLVGEITPETLLKRNTFIIWRGGDSGEMGDFELELDYRISAQGNSGVNYRSTELPEAKWGMRGYQADIDGKNEYTGQNYEEKGRGFLAYRGQNVRLVSGKPPEIVGVLGDRAELAKKIVADGWNHLRIVARGNRLQHFINGVLMAEVVDEDQEKGQLTGLLGVQVHVGPPMKVEYRNIWLKRGPASTAVSKTAPSIPPEPRL